MASNDLYTLKYGGEKSYKIELTLANIEERYAEICRNKIKNKLPLNEEEHIILCAFVVAMLNRTLRQKDNMEQFIDRLAEVTEEMEKAHNVEPKQSKELKEYKKDIHKLSILQMLPDITKLVLKMKVAFLCAEKGSKFITSDDPCNLFNPDLQWQKVYGPGLGQKNVQVTLPLSPDIMLCLSWSNLRGYIQWKKGWVEDANRMIVGQCYRYFISNNPKTKWIWFRKYPLELSFLPQILKHKFEAFVHRKKSYNRGNKSQ